MAMNESMDRMYNYKCTVIFTKSSNINSIHIYINWKIFFNSIHPFPLLASFKFNSALFYSCSTKLQQQLPKGTLHSKV